jgi:hypothetical protein
MQYRIRRFGIHPTALTGAIIYFVLALVFVPILYLASRDKPGESMPTIVFVLGPFLYAVVSYVFTAIACWLYNLVGGWTGGIAFSLEPDGAGAEPIGTR